MMKNKFYITTTLPYVNAEPHLGFALEIVQADVIARYHKLLGQDVFFNFGTDEHGLKIYRKALELKKDPKEYCDEYAKKFDCLKKALNLSYNNFIRTTDEHHIRAAQYFWKLCYKNGDIYKKNYKVKYCVGCELEKNESELINGRCEFHPDKELEIINEKNYFFKFSKYQEILQEHYEKNPGFVIPDFRFKEIQTFVKDGLQDFSVSRLKEKMPWGIDVPNDPKHVMYVWFDALINYISALGWPENKSKFKDFWPGIQVAGKDNLRQQTAIWQAMLSSAGLPFSKQVFVHGFITVNGQKISKSLGNTINPIEVAEKYGTDALRYFLLAKLNPYDDSDFTFLKFKNAYNSDLANGLGNLVARVAKLCEKVNLKLNNPKFKLSPKLGKLLEEFKFDEGIDLIWNKIKVLDVEINKAKPWEETNNKKLIGFLENISLNIADIAYNLQPYLPQTAEKILKQYTEGQIKSSEALFPRLK